MIPFYREKSSLAGKIKELLINNSCCFCLLEKVYFNNLLIVGRSGAQNTVQKFFLFILAGFFSSIKNPVKLHIKYEDINGISKKIVINKEKEKHNIVSFKNKASSDIKTTSNLPFHDVNVHLLDTTL